MAPEEVPLDQEVLGVVGNVLLRSEQKCTIVILKVAIANGRLEASGQSQFFADLTKKVTKWQKSPHACTEGRVLRFQCGLPVWS